MEDPDTEAQLRNAPEHPPTSTTAYPQRAQPADIASTQHTATSANLLTNPTHPRLPNTAISQPQATGTNDHPHGNVSRSQITGNQGEKYGDSSDGVWSMYLTEAEKQDRDVTESWKGDTEGILVFTGLFSATVATFIIESYQNLSPNPSDMTNALLVQITQQLVNVSTGTPLTIVATQSNRPFKPTASAVRVNVLWFLSLVLSLSCALSATLMQQWARRYRELAQHHGAPHRRARMRAYIFDGVSRFGMARAVATMPTLLHISVFLFFAGLIDFLFPVDTTVSRFTLVLVVAFALAYAILTILPNLYLNCPYATPLSGITWKLSQLFMIVGLKAALGIEDIFHNFLFKLWSQVNHSQVETAIENWRMAINNQVKVHRQWFSDGLRKSIERDAKDASSTVVTSALEWTLSALDEDKEIETFAAFVPGFFDSSTVPNATSAILPLMSEKPQTDTILGFRLSDLLKTCVQGTSPLNEEDRKSRVRVSMKCLWYFGRAYSGPARASQPMPSYILSTLASPTIIHRIHAEQDPVARVIGRCFCALVVMKRVAEVTFTADQTSDEVVACLSAVLGTTRDDVRLYFMWPGTVEFATMISIALGDIDSRVISAMQPDLVDLVQQTLNILSQALPVEAITSLSLDPSTTSINTWQGIFS